MKNRVNSYQQGVENYFQCVDKPWLNCLNLNGQAIQGGSYCG